MDATDAFQHQTQDRAELAGLPEIVLERAKALATERGTEGWVLRLDAPTYQAVLSHAESAKLRETFYVAWVTRASDQGPHAGRSDNGPLIDEILALRHEAAQLVGFKTYAELSLATKMADSPELVIDFLHDLARRSRPVAAAELAMLADYAGRTLEPWDVAFYSERLRQERLQLAEEELRPYFPLPRVLAGLFDLVGDLFDLVVAEASRAERLASDREVLRARAPRRHARRQLLRRIVRAAQQARRRVDGQLREPPKIDGARQTPGRAPRLQLHSAGRGDAVAADALARP